MDPFLDSITSRMTADPLFGSQNASRKTRAQIQRSKLTEMSVHKSNNRQVVHLESEMNIGSFMTGSGVLIHHIKNSLSDIDCFDWVK